jgi:hypothetical protein
LEDFPKAEKLMDELVWLETCGKHLTANAYQHCPKVKAFGLWLEKKVQQQKNGSFKTIVFIKKYFKKSISVLCSCSVTWV